MARVRDVSFIRKLCTLGLPPQTVAQCLLPELRRLIRSHSAAAFWVDRQGDMTNLYAERLLPPDAMAAYFEKHYAVKAKSFSDAFGRRAQSADPISFHSFSRAEQNTDYFRDVMQPLDAYHILYGILKDGTRAFAQVSLYRGSGDKPFDRASAEMLRSVLRYLATGLGASASNTAVEEAALVAEENLGIVSLTGTAISAPEGWRRSLRLAALSEVSPRHALKEHAAIELFVRQLLEELLPEQHRQPASREAVRDTAWGRFVIRAFRLPHPQGGSADQVGLLIRREEPRSVSLVRGTGMAALSPQQREVALLLAEGKTNREIAEQLGLSLNTASYHVKQVYARLDVSERSAVASKLLHLAQAATAY